MMQCFRRAVVVVLLLVALLGALAVIALRHSAEWLSADDAPAIADAIVVLGHDPSRVFQAADLYNAGFAPRVLLSRPRRAPRYERLEAEGIPFPWFEVAGRTILLNRGVPESAIANFGERLHSTVAEARAVAMLEPPLGRILVVTSPYHVLRARRVFNDHLPNADIRVVASKYETLDRAWWRDQEDALPVVVEIIKLAFYRLGGRMDDAAMP